MGLAMGLTAIAFIYSPWGRRSGAHLNPGLTVSFFRLGKVRPWDAVFYVLAQFVGGLAGLLIMIPVLGEALSDPHVHYVVTIPGSAGPAVAFVAEFLMSFGLMGVVLVASNSHRFAHLTGLFAGLLLLVYISVEAPYSGMSINPARTLASALPAHVWTGIWIYFTAPPLGMLTAAEAYVRLARTHEAICAKLHHDRFTRCIFLCGYARAAAQEQGAVASGA
jgi:aquaporin Z